MNGEEFARVLSSHGDRAYTYACWLLGNADEARDSVQDGLLRLWEHRAELRDGVAGGWLLRTVHRLCLDRLRQRAVRRHMWLEGDELPLAAADSPERCAAQSEQQATIGRALLRLSPRDRALIVMREMQDLSYEDIADVLEMPLGTLKAALFRARERLRRELTAAGVQP